MFLLRLTSYITILASVFFSPWWVSVVLLTACVFYFKWYWEGIFISLIYDTFYSIPISYLYNFEFVATLFAVVLFFILNFLKKRLFWTQEW